jgi:NAD(P)H-flavin reductase
MTGSHFMTPVPYRIQRMSRETQDTFTIEMASADGGGPFGFKPGQFNMLYLFAVGEVPISISGDPFDPRQIVHTIRAYGTVTSGLRNLKKGAAVGLRGPFGSFWPIEDLAGRDIFLCAGGIGIAPLRPVLYSILSRRERFGKVVLLYGERTPADLIYRRQLEKWRSRLDLAIEVTVDSARQGWRGNVGVVTTLIDRTRLDPQRTVAMLCGPEIMMHYAIEALRHLGLPEHQIYVSMERNMQCGIGLCGHCQLGPRFICKDGPVFLFSEVKHLFRQREM